MTIVLLTMIVSMSNLTFSESKCISVARGCSFDNFKGFTYMYVCSEGVNVEYGQNTYRICSGTTYRRMTMIVIKHDLIPMSHECVSRCLI